MESHLFHIVSLSLCVCVCVCLCMQREETQQGLTNTIASRKTNKQNIGGNKKEKLSQRSTHKHFIIFSQTFENLQMAKIHGKKKENKKKKK